MVVIELAISAADTLSNIVVELGKYRGADGSQASLTSDYLPAPPMAQVCSPALLCTTLSYYLHWQHRCCHFTNHSIYNASNGQ
jgi:hypothetical protein